MADTTFSAGTVIASAWLNDVNNHVYKGKRLDTINIINVKDPTYGATGDGTTDDTTAIQAAFTAATSGGIIYFPQGKYKLTDELSVKSGMRIIGASCVDKVYGTKTGNETPTLLYQATASKSIFVIGQGVCDVEISNMCLSSVQTPAAYTAPTTGKYGINCHGEYPYSSYRIDFNHLTFYQFERAINIADDTPGTGTDWQCDSITMERLSFFSNLHGIYLNTINGDAIKVRTTTVAVWTNGSAIYAKRSGYFSVDNTYWIAAETSAGVNATNCTGFYLADYQSDVIEITNTQGEPGLTYFLRVDNTAGFETNQMPINLRTCMFEAPIQLDRKCRLVFDHCRSTSNITVAGNDVFIEYDLPLFIGGGAFSVTGLRFKRIPTPAETGSTASIATATPVTIINFPISEGRYEVSCWLTSGGAIYAVTARVLCDGTNLIITGADYSTPSTNVTLSVSGRNIQITQISGATQTMQWSWRRLS